MLHEILLSLSGHSSKIWEKIGHDASSDSDLHKYVSEPEHAMLHVLAHLSALHIQIKESAARISDSHPSVICRAIGSSISTKHLVDFQRKILDVESSILQHDAGYVGGYGIVPLSTIVSEFAPWTRRLEWLRSVTQRVDRSQYTGRDMLDFLQAESCTGYSDIKDMAVYLLVVGQKVWIRMLASWVLYGKLTNHGNEDFAIQKIPSSSGKEEHGLDHSLLPAFVNQSTAEAILSIGNALNQIRLQSQGASSSLAKPMDPAMALMSTSLRSLESLSYPLNTFMLENVILLIDQSVSQNALSQLLPVEQIIGLLDMIRRYVLLGSGEFSVSLIKYADERIAIRQQTQTTLKPVRKVGRLDDLLIKDTELNSIMAKTWAELASLQIDEGIDDDTFVLGRKILSLRTLQGYVDAQQVPVISTLLPNYTVLEFSLPTDSALVLFLNTADMRTYSSINAYLLSLRRAELHISELWKLTSQRRCHPTPLGPPRSATSIGRKALGARRSRELQRDMKMRKHWASSSKAHFVINELGAYYHGEVIQNSWAHFRDWLDGDHMARPRSRLQGSRPGTASSTTERERTGQNSIKPQTSGTLNDQKLSNGDPRTLAHGHHRFLTALHQALLLENGEFLVALKELLNTMDHYIALFSRLQSIWQGLDLQEDDGILDAFSNYAQDEKDVLDEMGRTRDVLEKSITGLVKSVKEAEKQRAIDSMTNGMTQIDLDRQVFVPWQARTMDRLIMRLDFLAGRQDGDENIDALENQFDDE